MRVIEFDIGEMTLVAGRFGYLEFLFVRFVLVTGDTIQLLAFNLLLLVQMGFMDEQNFFGKFNLFGLELVLRAAVAIGSRTTGIHDSGSFLNITAANGKV